MRADKYWDSVTLHMPMEIVSGGSATTFTDTKGHVVAPTGAVTLSAVNSRVGGYAALFTGGTDSLRVANSVDYQFGLADFTVEGWFYPNSQAVAATLFDMRQTTNGPAISLRILSGTLYLSYAGADILSGAISATPDWIHVAVSRVSGTTRLFVNGVQVGSYSSAINCTEYGLLIGLGFIGWADELRVTKGVGRYSADFGPINPLAPVRYVSGLVKEAGNLAAGRIVRVYDRSSGALVGQATSDVYGYFFIEVPVSTSVYIVAIDPDGGTEYNALIFDRIVPAAT